MSENIHPTAVISDGAEIGEGTTVGPYSIIGPKVRIGAGNSIGSHVVIEGNTTIGNENNIFQFASVGAIPQDLKYHGEESTLEIGDKNIIREYATLQPGTEGGGMVTRVGNGNLFMACSHVGHDTIIGNSNIFANSVAVAGHVIISDHAVFGGLAGIHQGVKIGSLAFIAAGAMVSQDIPPFCMAQGDRAALVGLNVVGLQRAGLTKESIREVKNTFKDLFLGKGLFKDRLESLDKKENGKEVAGFLEFVRSSERGIAPVRVKQD